MNTNSQRIIVFSLALMLAFTPALSFAKGNDNDKKGSSNEAKQERNEIKKEAKEAKKETRHCFKAFGHLISKGFIKNKGEVAFDVNCFMPFGIKKKFGGVSSTTPDTIAPVISNLAVTPNSVKALITWKTDEKSDSTVFWSTSPNVNLASSSTMSATNSNKVKDHTMTIQGLTASTTYYVVVRSKDASGNVSTSSEISFRTNSLPADITSPVISQLSYLPATSTISVSWNTNESATSRVYFGTTTPVVATPTTPNVFDATLRQTHLLTVSGLSTSTVYYFAVESVDASGNKTVSPTFTATTTGQ
jgi:hypothetical protein